MSTAKRLFYYLLSLVSLSLLASGAGILISLLLDLAIRTPVITPVGEGGFNAEQLSLGLALLVIGGGLWWFFRRLIRQSLVSDPSEIGSTIRKLYLNLILTVTAITVLVNAVEFMTWLLGGFRAITFQPGQLAALLVTAGVWYFHWRISEREGHPSRPSQTLRRWYMYILSAWGLVSVSAGLVQILNSLLSRLPFWNSPVFESGIWSYDLRSSISVALFGGISWGFHWLYMARGDRNSSLRQVYLYLLAISGSAIAGLIALTNILFRLLQFIFGDAPQSSGAHFQFLSWALPLLTVAFIIWFYHERVTRKEASGIRMHKLSAQRIHVYIMSFIALGAMVGGFITLCGLLVDIPLNAFGESIVVTQGWWSQPLSLSLALLTVSIPLWLYYWRRAQALLKSDRLVEARSRSRRVFLYTVLAAGIITLATDLVIIIFQLLSGLLQSLSPSEVLRGLRWGLQTAVVALPVVLYFWRTLKQDQRAGAEKLARSRRVSVLLPKGSSDFIEKLEESLGYKVKPLYTLEGAGRGAASVTEDSITRLASEITHAPSDKVLLLWLGSDWQVIPYED